jgi:hypothetical protein
VLYLVKSSEDTLAAVEIDRSQAVIQEIRETPGQWLYHYTTLETAIVHILPEQRLRLSPFSRMRDPREYKRWFPPASGFIGDVSEEDLMRGYAATEARLNSLRDEFKLLSFTTDSESATEGVYGRGFARSRLWEAYAGLGSGVCIVLRKQDALEVIRPQLEALGRSAHGPVAYENGSLHTDITLHFEEALSGDVDAAAERIAANHLDSLFLTKNTEWESEREYRFVVRSPAEYEFVGVAGALVAICRGPASVRDAEHALRHFANELEIGLGFVQWDNNDPILLGRPLQRRA